MTVNTVSANGIDVAYEMLGSGPTVAFVGGLGMDIVTWRKTYANMFVENRYSVLMLNTRGTPPSSVTERPYSVSQLAQDCEHAVRALNIGEVYLVGASLGAVICQEWALAFPQRKKALALIATFGRQTEWLKLQHRGELELYRNGMTYPTDHVVAADLLQLYTPDELTDDERIARNIARLKSQDYGMPGRLGLFEASAGYDNRLNALAGIDIPAILFGFRGDVLTPALLVREVAARIKGSRYVEIDGAAHAGIFTRYQPIAREIIAFFDSVRGSGG